MEKINYYKWASETLSAPRARAFKDALQAIDNSKWSDEHRAARAAVDAIVKAHDQAVWGKVTEIRNQAEAQATALEEQARKLQEQAREIRKQADDATWVVRGAVYETAEYKTAAEISSALWHRDDDAVEPKRRALMEKYAKAQAKVGA